MRNWKRRLKILARDLAYTPASKKLLTRIPFVRGIYPRWERTHPIDLQYGIATSGYVPVDKLHPDETLTRMIVCYGGSQPGIVRKSLSALGPLEDYALADIGCGKGRVTIIGSEFPFRRVQGIELSRELVAIARANADIVAEKFRNRPPIEIHQGNALDAALPEGNLVVFMYHPFQEPLMGQMVTKLEAALKAAVTHLFVVYYNPVCGELFDASPAFTRWFADTLPYDPSEIGFGPDEDDTVVIWQSVRGARPQVYPRADRQIVTVTPLWRVKLGGD